LRAATVGAEAEDFEAMVCRFKAGVGSRSVEPGLEAALVELDHPVAVRASEMTVVAFAAERKQLSPG
jgi:hypothetical protein